MNAITVMMNATKGNIVEIDDVNNTEFIIFCNLLFLIFFFCVALRNIFIKLDLKFIQILRWCLVF